MCFRNTQFYTLRIAHKEGDKVIESTSTVPALDKVPNLIHFGKDADIWLGSIPEGKSKPILLSDTPFIGCMEKLKFNGELMGLWKWKVI